MILRTKNCVKRNQMYTPPECMHHSVLMYSMLVKNVSFRNLLLGIHYICPNFLQSCAEIWKSQSGVPFMQINRQFNYGQIKNVHNECNPNPKNKERV